MIGLFDPPDDLAVTTIPIRAGWGFHRLVMRRSTVRFRQAAQHKGPRSCGLGLCSLLKIKGVRQGVPGLSRSSARPIRSVAARAISLATCHVPAGGPQIGVAEDLLHHLDRHARAASGSSPPCAGRRAAVLPARRPRADRLPLGVSPASDRSAGRRARRRRTRDPATPGPPGSAPSPARPGARAASSTSSSGIGTVRFPVPFGSLQDQPGPAVRVGRRDRRMTSSPVRTAAPAPGSSRPGRRPHCRRNRARTRAGAAATTPAPRRAVEVHVRPAQPERLALAQPSASPTFQRAALRRRPAAAASSTARASASVSGVISTRLDVGASISFATLRGTTPRR
jgi:hypothetical protein